MSRSRIVCGLLAGALFLLSSVAHSVIGWSFVRAELAQVPALDPALLDRVGLTWRLGGASMIAFGLIVLQPFVQLARGRAASLVAARIVAGSYTVYGLWALFASGGDPFFAATFVAPGVLLAFATSGSPGLAEREVSS